MGTKQVYPTETLMSLIEVLVLAKTWHSFYSNLFTQTANVAIDGQTSFVVAEILCRLLRMKIYQLQITLLGLRKNCG